MGRSNSTITVRRVHRPSQLIIMFMTVAVLLSGSRALVVPSAVSSTRYRSSYWQQNVPGAKELSSNNYLVASMVGNSYGSNWPAASQSEGRNSPRLKDGALTRSGELNGEHERDAPWASAPENAVNVGTLLFEKSYSGLLPYVIPRNSGTSSLDSLAQVGYVFNSKVS